MKLAGMRRRWPWPNWSWPGAVVLTLAVLVGGGWATAVVFAASARTGPINDNTGNLLTAIGGVLAGSIATYVGAQAATRRRRHGDRDDELDAYEEEKEEGAPDT